MPNYYEYDCPVCNKQFEEGDDIVTCPICGTPHHRDCYNITGHCVNRGLHASSYSFLDDMKSSNNIEDKLRNAINAEINSIDNENEEDSERKRDFAKSIMPSAIDDKYDKSGEKIDGFEIGDIAATIRTNKERFLSVFKKRSKIGWNWGAFFFGSAYMFFRKMYKQGFAILALMMSTLMICDTLIIKFAPKYFEATKQFLETYLQGGFQTPDELVNASKIAMQASDARTASMITTIGYCAFLIIRIISALFADNFYKNFVYSLINRVTNSLESGASFTQTPLFAPQNEELSQQNMKKMYLSSKGGVSILNPLLVYMTIYMILSFIASR